MAEAREFDVVRVARSDGADTGPGYWPASSTPAAKKGTKDAAAAPAPAPTPRTKPQMTRLAEDDPRFIEWRIKLGILLKQDLSPSPDEGNPWYVQFPRGYWLYEKSKHLWVSGYPIKAKLFKSPQEFGVHLIWLLSASKDYKDCCCVHCNYPNPAKLAAAMDDALVITPNETPVPIPTPIAVPTPPKASSATPTPPAVPHKVTPVPLPPMPGQAPPKQQAAAPAASKGGSQKATPTRSPAQPVTPVPVPIPPSGSPQVQGHPAQQQQKPPIIQQQQQQQQQQQPEQPQPVRWSLQGSILFRAGELVWYQNGNTWRLGLVAAAGAGSYPMLPLGHAMVPQQGVTKTDADLRPFHAFSVPPVALPELKDKTFDQIPWDPMFHNAAAAGNDPSKREILALDASKLAASKIDASFSLWCPLAEDPNADPFPYYGCFFGAERLEIGDCLRIKPLPSEPSITDPDHAILGLRYIFTRKEYPGAIFFRGNVYQLASPDSPPSAILPDDQIPIALQDETQWRNQVNPAKPWRWVVAKENVTLNEQMIKGRFYPTHRIMPILNGAAFSNAIAQGQVDDQFPYLNSRMDGASGYVGRKASRMDTLGASISQGAGLSLEPAIREDTVEGTIPS